MSSFFVVIAKLVKDKLVLKGGTAINLFYMNLPRLSVDIDLDYLGETKEEMLADKAALGDFLRAVLFQKNYSLSAASKSYFALESYVFQYLNNPCLILTKIKNNEKKF